MARTAAASSLGEGVGGAVYALEWDSSGNMYVGGGFTTAGGNTANRIAKWNGSAWSAIGSGVNSPVYAIAADSEDNLYVGGNFTNAGGIAAADRIAKWNTSSESWSALTSLSAVVRAIAIYSDGGTDTVYVGGNFLNAGGNVSADRVAKWNGTAWSAMQTGLSSTVYSLVVDSNGIVYAGGGFSNAGGDTEADYIAKWTGSAWSRVGGRATSNVFSLFLDSSDNLYAAGQFGIVNGVTVNRIAKWNGTQWSGFAGGSVGVFYLRTVGVDSSGNVYTGGWYTNMINEEKPAFTQFNKNSISETPI